MSDYISKETACDIVTRFYGRYGAEVDNILIGIKVALMETDPAMVMEVQPLPHNSEMDRLLKEAGWE